MKTKFISIIIVLVFSVLCFSGALSSPLDDAQACIDQTRQKFSACEERPTGDGQIYNGGCGNSDYNASLCSCIAAVIEFDTCETAGTDAIHTVINALGLTLKTFDNKPKPYQVGDEVQFGQYQQKKGEKAEPIVWEIIAIENGNGMLMSDKALLTGIPYAKGPGIMDWDHSPVRKFLNGEFYDKVFSDKEKQAIVLVSHFATEASRGGDKYPDEDRVFLLSYDEVVKYFPNKEDRKFRPTEIAKFQNVFTNEGGNVNWMLRSNYGVPGNDWKNKAEQRRYVQDMVTCVRSTGEFTQVKNSDLDNAIIPVVWVDMSKIQN